MKKKDGETKAVQLLAGFMLVMLFVLTLFGVYQVFQLLAVLYHWIF